MDTELSVASWIFNGKGFRAAGRQALGHWAGQSQMPQHSLWIKKPRRRKQKEGEEPSVRHWQGGLGRHSVNLGLDRELLCAPPHSLYTPRNCGLISGLRCKPTMEGLNHLTGELVVSLLSCHSNSRHEHNCHCPGEGWGKAQCSESRICHAVTFGP